MKKSLIIVLVLVIAVIVIVWYTKSKVPSLVSYDNITKTGTYKYKGKISTIDLRTTGVKVGDYYITPVSQEVNVANSPIGTVIGMALRKDGVIIDKLTSV